MSDGRKLCFHCGTDVTDAPRVKDARGRYFCRPCAEAMAARSHAAAGGAVPAEGSFLPAEPKASPEVRAAPAPAEPEIYDLVEPEKKDDAPTKPCPGCNRSLPVDAAACPDCGFILVLKEHVSDRSRPEARTAVMKDGVMTCANCGYSLKKLKQMICPECGTPFRIPSRRDWHDQDNKRTVRDAYRRPLIYLGVGLAGLAIVALIQRNPMDIPFYLLRYAIEVPAGVTAFLLCCVLWVGFDAPVHLIALRLAGIYALVDFITTIAGAFTYGLLAFPVGGLFYISLLMKELDLDMQDAVIVGLITFICKLVFYAGVAWGLAKMGITLL